MKNKINIEITADGYKIDIVLDGKTYTEVYEAEPGHAMCVDGDFEKEDAIPDELYDALLSFDCFECQQVLMDLEYEDEDED